MAPNRHQRVRKRPRLINAEHPTSIVFPLDMLAGLKRECIRMGGVPVSTLVKMIIGDYLDRNRPRRKKKDTPAFSDTPDLAPPDTTT